VNRDEILQQYLKHFRRNVHPPCSRCRGLGFYGYSNGGTYHDVSVATCSFEEDICDKCWGSGDDNRTWTNILEVERNKKEWDDEQCLKFLGRKLGVSLTKIPRRIEQLADICSKESKRRKLPEGESPFWWSQEWDMLASILRSLIKSKA
jgi:hypothetical protein